MTRTNLNHPAGLRPEAPIVVGPWPSYRQFGGLPEQERWKLYGGAKAYREMLEREGFVMSESYDAFVIRVTRELDL
jgi:hypothetical protein